MNDINGVMIKKDKGRCQPPLFIDVIKGKSNNFPPFCTICTNDSILPKHKYENLKLTEIRKPGKKIFKAYIVSQTPWG